MPTSHPNQLNEIVQIAELLNPTRVLDIGIGNGKYGFLLREYLGKNRNLGKNQFIIDGIEGYQAYINDIHRQAYNTLFTLDLCKKIELPDASYDLCLLIDIIEHFDRDRGLEIIDFLTSISRFLLIATPWDIGDPGIRHTNPLENHVYQWKKKDFKPFDHHTFIHNTGSMIVLLGQDRQQINFINRKMKHRFYTQIYDYVRRLLWKK